MNKDALLRQRVRFFPEAPKNKSFTRFFSKNRRGPGGSAPGRWPQPAKHPPAAAGETPAPRTARNTRPPQRAKHPRRARRETPARRNGRNTRAAHGAKHPPAATGETPQASQSAIRRWRNLPAKPKAAVPTPSAGGGRRPYVVACPMTYPPPQTTRGSPSYS